MLGLNLQLNTRRPKQVIHRAERQLLQVRVKGINGILWDNTVKLDRCRSRLSSLVTSRTMEKFTNFINNIKESRFIIVRDRQVNKFNRLMGKDKDKELTAQPLAKTTQSQAQSNPNNWVINLSSTPLSQAQESFLSKGPY